MSQFDMAAVAAMGQPRSLIRCHTPGCQFLVHPGVLYGSFCCCKCYRRFDTGAMCKKRKHGENCTGDEAPAAAQRGHYVPPVWFRQCQQQHAAAAAAAATASAGSGSASWVWQCERQHQQQHAAAAAAAATPSPAAAAPPLAAAAPPSAASTPAPAAGCTRREEFLGGLSERMQRHLMAL